MAYSQINVASKSSVKPTLKPGLKVGILGGGQLARLMALQAHTWVLKFMSLAPMQMIPLRKSQKIGIKAALEFFTRPAPDWFVTAHGNISSVYQNYGSRIAINRNLGRFFTLGAEGAAIGDERSHEIRAGIVGGLHLGRSITTIAAGILQNSDKANGAYSTLTYYAPF